MPLLFLAVSLLAAEPAADLPAGTGAIEGVATYVPDPAKPWRYARYYVKRAQTGELAEAVIALRGKGLDKAAPKPQPQTLTVDQKHFMFQPETVAIRQGDSVKFTNSDDATHNVHATGEIASFNVSMPGGGSHTAKFERAGGTAEPVRIGCAFHSNMRAYVFVFNHPFYRVTAADGRFRLTGVPPGQYELELMHPAGELRQRQKVEVRAGEVSRVDFRVSPGDKQ